MVSHIHSNKGLLLAVCWLSVVGCVFFGLLLLLLLLTMMINMNMMMDFSQNIGIHNTLGEPNEVKQKHVGVGLLC